MNDIIKNEPEEAWGDIELNFYDYLTEDYLQIHEGDENSEVSQESIIYHQYRKDIWESVRSKIENPEIDKSVCNPGIDSIEKICIGYYYLLKKKDAGNNIQEIIDLGKKEEKNEKIKHNKSKYNLKEEIKKELEELKLYDKKLDDLEIFDYIAMVFFLLKHNDKLYSQHIGRREKKEEENKEDKKYMSQEQKEEERRKEKEKIDKKRKEKARYYRNIFLPIKPFFKHTPSPIIGAVKPYLLTEPGQTEESTAVTTKNDLKEPIYHIIDSIKNKREEVKKAYEKEKLLNVGNGTPLDGLISHILKRSIDKSFKDFLYTFGYSMTEYIDPLKSYYFDGVKKRHKEQESKENKDQELKNQIFCVSRLLDSSKDKPGAGRKKGAGVKPDRTLSLVSSILKENWILSFDGKKHLYNNEFKNMVIQLFKHICNKFIHEAPQIDILLAIEPRTGVSFHLLGKNYLKDFNENKIRKQKSPCVFAIVRFNEDNFEYDYGIISDKDERNETVYELFGDSKTPPPYKDSDIKRFYEDALRTYLFVIETNEDKRIGIMDNSEDESENNDVSELLSDKNIDPKILDFLNHYYIRKKNRKGINIVGDVKEMDEEMDVIDKKIQKRNEL